MLPPCFRKYFVPDEKTARKFRDRGVNQDKIEVVGHLVLDSVNTDIDRSETFRRLTGDAEEKQVITFLPGSRPFEIEVLLPFFLRIAELMSVNIPNAHFMFALSPFADKNLVNNILAKESLNSIGGVDPIEITLKSGHRVFFTSEHSLDAMRIARLVITIPGTNTLQIGAMGTPMLVTLPLNRADLIPIDGLLGLISPKIFPIGLLKKRLFLKLNNQVKYVALPNMISERNVVPEIRGLLEPHNVAERALELVGDAEGLERISLGLKEITRERGAAGKMADALHRFAGSLERL